MSKIIRTPTRAEGGITPAEEAAMRRLMADTPENEREDDDRAPPYSEADEAAILRGDRLFPDGSAIMDEHRAWGKLQLPTHKAAPPYSEAMVEAALSAWWKVKHLEGSSAAMRAALEAALREAGR
jgi:hypothetical protein